VPDDLPLVINPKGKAPDFTLRDDRFVSAEQVKRALEAKRRLVIIDARSPSDWIQFHVPGAVPVPYYDTAKLERIPNDGTWVIAYCACPHHASGEVVDALRRRNYPHTAVLDEGILFWRKAGYPIEGEAVDRGSAPLPKP
jgi:cytochrome c oxidase cbb3-type subunit 3/ubiquinol-cytochrome c reductase cytochrome c subunit